ncbi:MAG: adenine phosphoribosyltransferase [Deltaproteobacteria bacterium]|nr:adenine phosphoribosyltransferase [Deltaproteobacteria bacterium]
MSDKIEMLKGCIRDIPDFPKEGIVFKDITPLLLRPEALCASLDLLAEPYKGLGVTAVAGMESRGFIFGVPVAERLKVGFVPVRKPGKLPAETVSQEYTLEYGTDRLEMHKDAVSAGDKVLVVDDLLATGGTAEATVKLIQSTGAEVVGVTFVIELGFLEGRSKLEGLEVKSLIVY